MEVRYTRQKILLEAVQYTGDNIEEIYAIFGTIGIGLPKESLRRQWSYLKLATLNGGQAHIAPGEWLVPNSEPNTFAVLQDHEIFAYSAIIVKGKD